MLNTIFLILVYIIWYCFGASRCFDFWDEKVLFLSQRNIIKSCSNLFWLQVSEQQVQVREMEAELRDMQRKLVLRASKPEEAPGPQEQDSEPN